jgi:solute carrier family 27 fatty acid transporter 1/4
MASGKRMKEYAQLYPKFVAEGYQVSDMWYNSLARYASKDCIVFEDAVYSFQDVEHMSNRISHWGVRVGLKKGDVVALDMENRPEFIFTWIGLTKIGVVCALINHNIKMKPLIHSIQVAKSKFVIYGAELNETLAEITEDVSIPLWCYGSTSPPPPFAESLDKALEQCPTTPTDPKLREGIGMLDTYAYIYTSGTTGLPKACIITHAKYFTFGCAMTKAFTFGDDERVYCCLPLYHSAGGGLGCGSMVYHGTTLILKAKFSARTFWADCKR